MCFLLEYSKVTAIPLKDSFGDAFKQGSVVSVDLKAKKATLDNGSVVQFSHLVLATGSTGVYPARTEAKTLEELEKKNGDVAEDMERSSSVVVIGGGAVGIELAGEILDRFPDKKITIVNSGDKLLSNVHLGEKLQDNAKSALEAKGVVVKCGKKRKTSLIKEEKREREREKKNRFSATDERVTNMDALTFDKYVKQEVKTDKVHTIGTFFYRHARGGGFIPPSRRAYTRQTWCSSALG